MSCFVFTCRPSDDLWVYAKEEKFLVQVSLLIMPITLSLFESSLCKLFSGNEVVSEAFLLYFEHTVD